MINSKMRKTSYTVLRFNNQMFCTICQKWEELKMPIPIKEMVNKIKEFNLKHKKCKEMSKKKDFTPKELENLLQAHQKSALDIIRLFEKKQDINFENFVGGDIPHNVCFGDYYFNMDDIYFDLLSNQPKGKILEHQDYIVNHNLEKGGNGYINYKSYCSGARFT